MTESKKLTNKSARQKPCWILFSHYTLSTFQRFSEIILLSEFT